MATLSIRKAVATDVPRILQLLRDDDLAKLADVEVTEGHLAGFRAIDGDNNQFLAVGERDGTVVATVQVTIIPGLSRNGMRRALIEAVRVQRSLRGQGLGTTMLHWALDHAEREGCGMVQLLMDKRREGAGTFYEKLGFSRSHDGFRRYF